MSYDRPIVPPAAAEHRPPAAGESSLRLQILSTEHWSLLASRSLAWNESFSRAGMFLSALSGAIVALALVAQAADFGQGFRLFALVILPVVLFIGVGTVLRIGASNYHDALCVAGMNRIRAGYLELDPGAERFLVMSAHDDAPGMLRTMAVQPGPAIVHLLAATPFLVATVNSVLFAAIFALLSIQLGAGDGLAVGIGAISFFVSFAAHGAYARRVISRGLDGFVPMSPSPE